MPRQPKAELRAGRKALGLTQHGLAEALQMGKHGWQSISKWESDNNDHDPPGPVMVAVRLMRAARAIEAQRAKTVQLGLVHESASANGGLPKGQS